MTGLSKYSQIVYNAPKMKKQKKYLLLIFFLALLVRIYRLGTFPFGFHADEVRVGWNAFSILKTGMDDRGNILSLYYNTFGDFRPTGIFYLTIPSIILFGASEFAVRFPSALLGALTVIPLFFLAKELTKNKKVSYFASALLALSPWHISVSRATSEVAISMFITFCGLYLFIKALESKNKKEFVKAVIVLSLSYFFYHSVRVLTPFFIFAIAAYKFKDLKVNTKKLAISSFAILSLLTLILASNKEARGRFDQISIFSDLDVQYELSRMPFEEGPNKVFIARAFHNKVLVYSRRFVNEYTKYFSSNFFLDSKVGSPARYQTIGIGVVTYMEFLFLIGGLIYIARKKKINYLPLILLILAPLPAALTTEDSPNLHRALFMIPFISIIGAYGIVWFTSLYEKYAKKIMYVSFGLLTINFIFFLHMYFVHAKVHIPLYRNVGAKELALKLGEIQKNYDKIIVTNIPDDPYPWIAYFTKKDPKTFNIDAIERKEGVWTHENYLFTGQRCPSRDAFTIPDVERLLVVDAEGCATESNLLTRSDVNIIDRILRPDESEVYVLWERVE